MVNNLIYIGQVRCKTCFGNLFRKVQLGTSEWKRCIECTSLTPIKEADNLQPLDPQPE